MDNEKELLTRCLAEIEQVLNWGPSGTWSNTDFEDLSERIAAKTQVRLSVSTLKRIWGRVRYDSSPTPATLNVLARFLGYAGWRDFQGQAVPADGSEQAASVVAQAVQQEQRRAAEPKPWRMQLMYGVAGLLTLCVVLVFLLVKGKTPVPVSNEFILESYKVSDDLPNSVVFTYSIGILDADSVFIQQSWDPTRRQLVSAAGGKHTSIYYKPGYFNAKLIADGVVLQERVVFIKTKGWKGMVDGKPPVYLSDAETHLAGGLGVNATVLRDKIGSPVFTDRWVVFSNVRTFDSLRTDAFTLDVTLRNTSTVEQSLCRGVKITLLGAGDAMVIPLVVRGCVSDIGVLTRERWIAGNTNDLSAFGCDFKGFEHVRCEARDGRFRIFVNDVLALEEQQRRRATDIVGIRIAFEGTGEIATVKLSGKTSVLLNDRFGTALNPGKL